MTSLNFIYVLKGGKPAGYQEELIRGEEVLEVSVTVR